MVAVFAGFAAGPARSPLQQMGFGLAVAVFLDATIVRTILVPSAMKLLGDRNWYLPEVAAVAAEAGRRGPRARSGSTVPGFAGRAGRGRASPGTRRASSDSRRQSGSRERVFSLSSSRRTSRAIHLRGRRLEEEDPLGLVDRGRVQRAVPLPDLPERPRHALLDLVPVIGRRSSDQRQVAEELSVGGLLRPHGSSSDHREGAALHEGFRSSSPRSDRIRRGPVCGRRGPPPSRRGPTT